MPSLVEKYEKLGHSSVGVVWKEKGVAGGSDAVMQSKTSVLNRWLNCSVWIQKVAYLGEHPLSAPVINNAGASARPQENCSV
jgi:hypothetical protein